MVAGRVGPIVLATPAALAMYHAPWWIPWQGIPQPIMGFVPNLPAVLAFGSAFGFGWFLHRQTRWLELLKRDWAPYLVAAVVLTAGSMAMVGAVPQLHVPAMPAAGRASFAAAYNVAGWCWIFGLIGMAARFLDEPSPRWRYLADSSFFVYIIHLPVSYLLSALVMRWQLHWAFKFLFIVGTTTAASFALYHWLVRSTFVGRFLNGRKYPRTGGSTSVPSTSPG